MIIRPMRSDDADEVAVLVHNLARETRPGTVLKLTGALLRANADLVDVVVAEDRGRVIEPFADFVDQPWILGARRG